MFRDEKSLAAIQHLLGVLVDTVADQVVFKLKRQLSALPESVVVEPSSPKKGTKSEETKRRMSLAQQARRARARGEDPPEIIASLASFEPSVDSSLDGVQSKDKRVIRPETRRKIAEALKNKWAMRRASLSPSTPEPALVDFNSEGGSDNLLEEDAAPTSIKPVASTQSTIEIPDASIAVKEGYTGDVFYISADGHYIGDDGFIVPKDFNEFTTRYPKYIETWVRRRLSGFGVEEDIEDWCQDLLIHMKYLPLKSKHRGEGKEDVIQTFDPFAYYGASERRWRSYMNFILANKFNTIHGKKQKNPVCRMGNLTIASETNPDMEGEVSDEFIYSKSSYLSDATEKQEKNKDDMLFTQKYIQYVFETDPDVYPILEAVYMTGRASDTVREFCKTCQKLATTKEVSEGHHEGHEIGITQKEFNRAKTRLKQLATSFISTPENKPDGELVSSLG